MLTLAKRLAPLCQALSALGAADPCEDEESFRLLLDNAPTNEVSERGLKMPFIEEPGRLAVEDQLQSYPHEPCDVGSVSTSTTLLAHWSVVSVFPQAFGSSITTAPARARTCRSW